MNISQRRIVTDFQENEAFVLARCGVLGDRNRLLMTAQKLNLTGTDLFSPIYVAESMDGGHSWSGFHGDSAFENHFLEDGTRCIFGDVTHVWHKQTKVDLAIGRLFAYPCGHKAPRGDAENFLCYAVYNEEKRCYGEVKRVELEKRYPFGITTWGSQTVEEANGELLIPVAIRHEDARYTSAVMRCGFDGKTLSYISMGNELDVPSRRGVFEASLTKFRGKYYLTLRHDEAGYVSASDDGQHFSAPVVWRWDDGEILPTYNTQQHWLQCGDKLCLVYTRRAENNGHVFRHRAPLFMAEVNTESLRVERATERIVVPERGARLGNFGVTALPDGSSLIIAAEWMQPMGCEKYGSDNSIFVVEIVN